MKTVLLSAAALVATLASPAFAADYNFQYSSANDNIGTYPVTANVSNFCKLGTVTAPAGNHTTVDGSFTTGDANVHVALQDANDQAQSWNQTLAIENSICNSNFQVFVSTENGGLSNTATTTNDRAFLKKVDYTVSVAFGGKPNDPQSAANLQNATKHVLSGTPHFGTFTVQLAGSANNSGYLLAGAYSDTIHMTMSPSI